MEIIVAETAGFCFGVRRAISLAFEASQSVNGPIWTLGPIIHNPQVVKQMEASGVYAKPAIDDIESGTVIVRSHGVTHEEVAEAKERGLTLIDATCPYVTKNQKLVKQLTDEGYHVVIVGEEHHAEVRGMLSYANPQRVSVVESLEKAHQVPRAPMVGVVAQTTQAFQRFREVVDYFLATASEVRVYNTICDATTDRQVEAQDLARTVDCMLVVGGFNSANTNRLTELCRAIQPRSHQIETPDQLDPAWFAGVRTVGVTAGASTPRWLIEDVINQLAQIDQTRAQ